jgi:hypothetical protein
MDDDLDFELGNQNIEGLAGLMWYRKQTVLVNSNSIEDIARQMADELFTFQEEYSCGIIQTVIHETRHCMLETNLFLSEEKYPLSENAEDAVENFCLDTYDRLPKEFQYFEAKKKEDKK